LSGAAHKTGANPKSRRNEKGYVRGFDVRTGKRLWIFHTIPLPGEFGNDTWEKDSWTYTGNNRRVGADFGGRGIGSRVPLPVEMPTGDYYGGHRPGKRSVRGDSCRSRSANGQAEVAFPSSCTTASGTMTFRVRRSW